MELLDLHLNGNKRLNILVRPLPIASLTDKASERHRHDFHSIYFLKQARGRIEIDFEEYETHTNQILILPKGAIHREIGGEWKEGFAILFEEDFFSEVQKQLLSGFIQYAVALRHLLLAPSEQELELLLRYVELLQIEQDQVHNQNQKFLLQNLMLALLNKLEGLMQISPQSTSFIGIRRPFQRFIELVEEHFIHHKQVEFYTESLQLTPRKLNDILKQITGQTAANFIIERIIIEAKRELCFSEYSVKEIAHKLGYDSPYYFSRLFKKRTQLSPEQFRSEFAE